MTLSNIRYWQWLLASALIGSAAAAFHQTQQVGSAELPRDLSGQQARFEKALFGKAQGQPLLRNLSIHPARLAIAGGGTRRIHMIQAEYCTGEAERFAGGWRFVWRDATFIAPAPYRVRTDLGTLDPRAPKLFAAQSHGHEPTVLDLVAVADSLEGVHYSYAWWEQQPWLTYGLGSVLLLGLICPALIHRSAFGSFRRPKAVLETQGQPEIAPPGAPAVAEAVLAPVLEDEAVAPNPAEAESREYGMRRDDFYPTAKARPEHEAQPEVNP